jgi:hypothetical protein
MFGWKLLLKQRRIVDNVTEQETASSQYGAFLGMLLILIGFNGRFKMWLITSVVLCFRLE